jgi:hypothetical protein
MSWLLSTFDSRTGAAGNDGLSWRRGLEKVSCASILAIVQRRVILIKRFERWLECIVKHECYTSKAEILHSLCRNRFQKG